MEIKGDTLLSYVQKAKEMLSPSQALQETIDNGFDANANNIYVMYDSQKRKLKISDDGHGFTKESLTKFFTNIRTHMVTDSDPINRIGGGGWGGFDALCKLAHYEEAENGVSCVKLTSFQGNVKHIAVWYLSNSEKLLTDVNAKFDVANDEFKYGTEIEIDDCYPYTKQQWDDSKKDICKIYSLILDSVCVFVNDGNFKKGSAQSTFSRIKPIDPMHLDALGDKINIDGVHLCENGYIYDVKTFKCKSKSKELSFKAINLFIPNKLLPKGDTSCDGGVYAVKAGKRYINMGNNYAQMWGISGQAHAVSQRRILLCIDTQEQSDFFEIGGNKGAGISNLCTNQNLKEYKTEDGSTVFAALKYFYNKTDHLYSELNKTLTSVGWKDKKNYNFDEYMVILKSVTDVHKMRPDTIVKKISEVKKKNRKPSANQVFRDHICEIQKLNDSFKWDDQAMKDMYRMEHDSLNCKLFNDKTFLIIKNQWCPDFVILDEYQRLAEFMLSKGKKPWQIMEFLNEKIRYENEKINAYSEVV